MEVLLCERVNDLRHSLFHLNCTITTASEVREEPKVTGSKVTTIGRVRNCLGQIVCDKDGVVDWCIVLLEIPLTRFEECWPLPKESIWTPLKLQHSNPNPNPLANQLWCSDFLTPPRPLIIPHRLPAFLESLMPLKNRCLIHARLFKSSLKPSIRFCGIFFFVSLKQNSIAYPSSKVSPRQDWIFEIPNLWQSGFSRVYSNCCCSSCFEPEILKIGLSSHKIYSNNILNFQGSTAISNACTKKTKQKKKWILIEFTTYIYWVLQNIPLPPCLSDILLHPSPLRLARSSWSCYI